MSDTGNICQGCGKPQKPGTVYCTGCGLPVPSAASGAGDSDTATVLAPGKGARPGENARPAGNAAADQPPTVSISPAQPVAAPGAQGGAEWRPGQDWSPGTGWQQEQQVPWWLTPSQPGQQGFNQPGFNQPGFGLQGTGPQGMAPQGPAGTGPRVSPGGQRPSRLPLIAVTIAAAALLGAGAGAYVLLAHPFSSSPGTTAKGANAANVSQSTPGTPATTLGSSTAPATPAQSSSTTPAAPPASQPASQGTSERQAATRLAGLLQQSSSDRSAINSAYNDAYSCGGNLTGDQQTFQQAASNRQYLLNQLANLPGAGALPAQMLSDLTSAWQASLSVDNDYAQWAGDENTSGCTLQDPSYAAATTPNTEATADKNAFASLWNPIAQQYSLPQYTGNEI